MAQLVDYGNQDLTLPSYVKSEREARQFFNRYFRREFAGKVVYLWDADDACILTIDRRFEEGAGDA